MKKFKEILALVLVAALFVTLFAACANNTETPNTDVDKDTPANTDADKQPTGDTEKTPADDKPDEPKDDNGSEEEYEEPAELIYYIFDYRSLGGDYGDHVEKAVNELMLEEINATVDIVWTTGGNWSAQALTALAAGERIDVISIMPKGTVDHLYPQGFLMPLTDLLEEYAPEALEICKDYLGPYSYDGEIWGLPTFRNFSRCGFILMNKSMLEDMGMLEFAENMTSFSEYEEIMEAVYEKYTKTGSGVYASHGNFHDSNGNTFTGTDFSSSVQYDDLGDSLKLLGATDDGKVFLQQEHEGFIHTAKMNAEWYEKGWIYPDAPLGNFTVDELMKNEALFGYTMGSEYGVATTKGAAYGYELVAVQTNTGMIKTSQIKGFGIGVPSTCEEPVAAVKFINEMYTNEQLLNLLVHGVEGTDYTIEEDQVVYVESDHYYQGDFLYGNCTLLTPLMGNGTDFYEIVKQINKDSAVSRFMGFSLDTGDLDLIMSQLSAVTGQYEKMMQYLYTPEDYADYIAKLEAAGVRDYIDAAQKQLDAWLASH